MLLAIAALLALVLATLAVWGFALGGITSPLPGFELSASAVEELIASWGVWAVAGSIGLMVLHSFVPFPAELVAIANGMLFGPLWGTLITWTGAMLGRVSGLRPGAGWSRPFVRQELRPCDIKTQSIAGRCARAAAPSSSAGSSR